MKYKIIKLKRYSKNENEDKINWNILEVLYMTTVSIY